MTEEQQTIRRFSVEEMGLLIPSKSLPHWVHLKRSFLTEQLGINRFEKATNIGCPFCETGCLRLVNVDPIVGKGGHVGDGYSYDCSNDDCDGTFSGSYRLRYVD